MELFFFSFFFLQTQHTNTTHTGSAYGCNDKLDIMVNGCTLNYIDFIIIIPLLHFTISLFALVLNICFSVCTDVHLRKKNFKKSFFKNSFFFYFFYFYFCVQVPIGLKLNNGLTSFLGAFILTILKLWNVFTSFAALIEGPILATISFCGFLGKEEEEEDGSCLKIFFFFFFLFFIS